MGPIGCGPSGHAFLIYGIFNYMAGRANHVLKNRGVHGKCTFLVTIVKHRRPAKSLHSFLRRTHTQAKVMDLRGETSVSRHHSETQVNC